MATLGETSKLRCRTRPPQNAVTWRRLHALSSTHRHGHRCRHSHMHATLLRSRGRVLCGPRNGRPRGGAAPGFRWRVYKRAALRPRPTLRGSVHHMDGSGCGRAWVTLAGSTWGSSSMHVGSGLGAWLWWLTVHGAVGGQSFVHTAPGGVACLGCADGAGVRT